MPAPIVPQLLDLMPDTIEAQAGATNAYGEFVESGGPQAIQCYISGSNRLVRDLTGREVMSTVQIFTGGVFNLTVDHHRYKLPERFMPDRDRIAIGVKRVSDENGPHHEVVMLP